MFACVVSSCQSADEVEADFLNDSDLLNANFVDTLSINATLRKSKPINLSAAQSNNVFLLGGLDDPIFGKSNASLCMQFTLGTGENNLTFDSIPQLDSVVLSLAYTSGVTYGYAEEPQSFNVYELTDSLVFVNADEVVQYFTDTVCTVDQLVGSATVIFDRDSIVQMDTTLAPANVINIKLDNELGEKFINAGKESNDSVFFNIVSFLEFFKGLAVVPEEGNTAIASFNLLDPNTQLSFYYKAFLPGRDTLSERKKSFLVRAITGTSKVLALNEFKHDFTGSEPQTILDNGGEVTDIGYIKSMAGLEMVIDIPGLFELGDVFINKADLEINNILTDVTLDSINFPQPPRISYEVNDNVGDPLYDGSGIVSVVTDSLSGTRMNQYNVPLSLSLQGLLEQGKGNGELIIKIQDSPLNPYRIIVNGPEAESFPMKLKLHYTVKE